MEEKLKKTIKKNFKSIGVDTAKITGIIFLKTDDIYIYIDGLVLGFKTENKKEVYGTMVRTFEKLFNEEDLAIIEDTFIGFNRKGSIELTRYGAFAIAEVIKKSIPYEIISAVSARSKFKIDTRKYGKGKSKKAVADWVNEIGVKLVDNNLVDGFVLALCGICEEIDFTKKTKKKSAKCQT